MFKLFRRLRRFPRRHSRSSNRQPQAYRGIIPALERRDQASLEALARGHGTAPEVLYYLAQGGAPEVRRLVAANPSTPAKANELLSADLDQDVRCALARKIGRLVPDLDAQDQDRLHRQAVDLLQRLAEDRLPRVRQIVAEEIKRTPNVPRALIRRLGEDVEAVVSAPVLRYSPLLRDEDLIEIIAATKAEEALAAIAGRAELSADVSDAIVATVDIPAVAALLANGGADIRAETLEAIVEQAEGIREWHAPLVVRPDLSLRAMRRIAGFVGSALIEEMVRLHDLDAETAQFLAKRVRERLKQEQFDSLPERVVVGDGADIEPVRIDDDSIARAAEAGRQDFVVRALAQRCALPPDVVGRVLNTRNGRAVTALVWRAGFGMRVAVKLQQNLLRIPAGKMVYAREGLYFPLTPEEMTLQLELFGIPA